MQVLEATTPRVVPHSIQGTKTPISVNNRKEQLMLQKRAQGVIGLLLEKMRVGSPNSLPQMPDSVTTMFDSVKEGSYVFRVGPHMMFHLPGEFIEATDMTTNETFDELIKDWIFQIDEKEIGLIDWINHDIIDTLIKDSRARAAKAMDLSGLPPEKIQKIEEKKMAHTEVLRSHLANFLSTLLPKEKIREEASKSKFPTFGKNSVVTIAPRLKSKN